MITYTDKIKPIMKYKPKEILSMSPAQLRKELSRLCANEPEMAGKIEVEVGFEPRWSKMTTTQYYLIALAWAELESDCD